MYIHLYIRELFAIMTGVEIGGAMRYFGEIRGWVLNFEGSQVVSNENLYGIFYLKCVF